MLAGKVDFVIAGAQKGGTTALDAHLRDHPEVCMADVKEVRFCDDEERFRNRRADYAAYHAHFQSCTDRCRVGETTPVYMYWEPAPRRLWLAGGRGSPARVTAGSFPGGKMAGGS